MNKFFNKENVLDILKEYERGEKNSALKKMKRYIKYNKKDFVTLYNYSVMLDKAGKKEEAINNYKIVLKNDPKNWRAISNLYLAYFDQQEFSESLILADRLLELKPNDQPTLRDKAHIQFYLNELNEAKKNVEASIKLNPKDYIALNVLGMILDKMGLFSEAKKVYLSAIKIKQNYYPTYSNLGKTYLELMDPTNAIKILELGIKINPGFVNAYNNLGTAYNKIGEYKKAIEIYLKILEKNPEHKDVNSNLALSYFNNKNYIQAEKYFLKTNKINPNDMNFKKNFAHFLLYKKDYSRAWHYWDERLNKDEYYINRNWKNKIRKFVFTGSELKKGDKLLIIKEQGIGDEILYSTIYKDLINQFPDCLIETEERLISLFKRSYSAEKNIIPFLSLSNDSVNLKKFDKVIFAGSLGKFFRKDVNDFSSKSYLEPLKENVGYVSSLLNQYKGIKIGLSWKSKREFYGEGKSININDFESLLTIPNSHFINLQYGNIDEDLKQIINNDKFNLLTLKNIDLMNDFEKISALLRSLDLFITVSNSTAHLAGALNVPTILIKPKSFAIFHYWNQSESKTPWYDSIELVEQSESMDIMFNNIKEIIFSKFNL